MLRQLLTESLVFALGGGICGVILAVWTNKVLASSVPRIAGGFAVELNLSLDWRVLGFAAAVSVTATVLCGLWPAWRTSQSRSLTASNREIQAGRRPRRAIGLIAQVAMSLVLLFVAGSFVQALLRLHATDPGFEVANRLYAYVFIPSPPFTAETGREFYSQAVERLRSLRGVRTAAVTSSLPLMPSRSECTSSIDGPRITARADAVGDGFFDTMGVDILAGRDFTIADFAADLEPVIVNATLAGRIWPRGPSVGERILIGCDVPRPALVIGVARDTATRALGEAPQPHLYRAFARQYTGGLTAMVVDTTDNPVALVQPVRRALVGLGQGIRVYAVQPLGTHVDQSYALVRWQASIVTAFGVLALLLASIGLYGAMAYRVALRTPEIGVRMALGARRHDIFREVLGHGLAIVLVGVLIGEVLTAALTRFIGSVQEGIAPSGLTTHLAVGLIWIAVACLACFLPAAHAARVNPLVALRYE